MSFQHVHFHCTILILLAQCNTCNDCTGLQFNEFPHEGTKDQKMYKCSHLTGNFTVGVQIYHSEYILVSAAIKKKKNAVKT